MVLTTKKKSLQWTNIHQSELIRWIDSDLQCNEEAPGIRELFCVSVGRI